MDEIVLDIAQDLDSVWVAARTAREVCSKLCHPLVDEDFLNAAELAMSEGCTNAVIHRGNGGGQGRIVVSFEIWRDRIVMKIKDKGPGFDIASVAPPRDGSFAGGYGIHIMRSMMDEVLYFTHDGWNVLSMTKFLDSRNRGEVSR